MSIIWLASYPKSGNTWLRALLTSYLHEDGGPASINNLDGAALVTRSAFDEMLGVSSCDLTVPEFLRLRPLLHRLMAEALPHRSFVKVHDACIRTESGPLFPRAATAGAVYLLRNPLDVALSYAHHQQWSIDRTIRWMNAPDAAPDRRARSLQDTYPEPILSWSANVASWVDADLPVHVARYEDFVADALTAFGAVVRFAGLDWNAARGAEAVANATFERLRRQELAEGFRERQPSAPSFFRSGVADDWRRVLTPTQVRALVEAHAPVMDRFGYLADAEAFLSGAAPH